MEEDEDFTVTLSNPSGFATIADAEETGRILNDDQEVEISATNANQNEGDVGTTPFTFTVTRSGDDSAAASVDWAVTGTGGNPVDLDDFGGALPSGTASFAAGETEQTITVNVSGDTVIEPNEEFTVTLSNPSPALQLGTAITAVGTVVNDDDSTLAIAATDAQKAEGDGGNTTFTFTVTRSGDLSLTTTVNYSITGGTADFTDFGGATPSGMLTFNPGETTQTISLDVSGDTDAEPDETFDVTLDTPSAPTTITTGTATGEILDDDTVHLAVTANGDATATEGDAGTKAFNFTLNRSVKTSGALDVDFIVVGSGANPADDVDFGGTLPSGTISFADGETTKTISVDISGDGDIEPDETFEVQLQAPAVPFTFDSQTATGTIQNDDELQRIDIAANADADAAEGNAGTKGVHLSGHTFHSHNGSPRSAVYCSRIRS